MQIHETEALTNLHHDIHKQQRAIMRRMFTIDAKIAKLHEQRAELAMQLCEVAPQRAIAWACQGQDRAEVEVRVAAEPDYEIDCDDDEEGAA